MHPIITAASPTTATSPPSTTTPERPPTGPQSAKAVTLDDAAPPAESVRVTDVPAHGVGRAYLVERELEHDGYGALTALVADYVEQAERLGEVPMAVLPLTGTPSSPAGGSGR